VRAIVKFRDTLRSSVQKRLNRDQDAVWAVGSDIGLRNCVLDVGPQVLRYVAMATNFGTRFAITGFVDYNFGCMTASDN